MALYLSTVEYKGLHNVSPQIFANNLITVPPGHSVVIEAHLADRILEAASPTFAYMDQADVNLVVKKGFPECRTAYKPSTVATEVVEDPPVEASSEVVEPSLEDSSEEESGSESSTFPSEDEVPADVPSEDDDDNESENESPEILTNDDSSSSDSTSGETESVSEPKKPKKLKKPKLNRDRR